MLKKTSIIAGSQWLQRRNEAIQLEQLQQETSTGMGRTTDVTNGQVALIQEEHGHDRSAD